VTFDPKNHYRLPSARREDDFIITLLPPKALVAYIKHLYELVTTEAGADLSDRDHYLVDAELSEMVGELRDRRIIHQLVHSTSDANFNEMLSELPEHYSQLRDEIRRKRNFEMQRAVEEGRRAVSALARATARTQQPQQRRSKKEVER
jgi:hypothetical protein